MEDSDDLLNDFIEEAREHLTVIESSLLALEHKLNDQNLLNELFRSVHTIKGGAVFLGLTNISSLAHTMESLMTLARSGKLKLTRTHIDVLLSSLDRLMQMIDDPQYSHKVDIHPQCQRLNELINSPNELPPDIPSFKNQEGVNANASSQDETAIIDLPIVKNLEGLNPTEKNISQETLSVDSAQNNTPVKDNSTDDLFSSFIEESQECLALIDNSLNYLHNNPQDTGQLNELFRYVHTIKGGAYFLGLQKVAQLAHEMENTVGFFKNATFNPQETALSCLFEAYTLLKQLLTKSVKNNSLDISDLCQRLIQCQKIPSTISSVIPTPPLVPTVTAIPIEPALLSETFTATIPLEKNPVIEHPANFHHPETEESIRVNVKRLNKLIDLASELVLVRNQIFRLCEPLIPQTPGLKIILHNFNRITSEVQEEIMSTRMQPIGIIFNKFPRLIRQLEKDLGKKLELVTEGADVELDKTIIEALTDPVTHIIRNMADHGIESPEERLQIGKPSSGTILQKAFHESGQVIIQFSDDGRGIDPEAIAAKALKEGMINAENLAKMSTKEKMNLIFLPGFSTAKSISSVSGRGIGMDVVKTNIEACGGTIDINSQLGKWTSITMTLPLTMAIISALIVSVQESRFAFPQGNLEEMVLLESKDYHKRVGQVHERKMLSLRGYFVPLISLAQSLNMPERATIPNEKPLYILIVKDENNRVAIIVDKILGSEEIVVKPMPDYFKQLKCFSGTSILGDGMIAMIIDVHSYIKKNQLAYTELQKDYAHFQHQVEQEAQSLLIFDNNTEEHFALALSWIRRIDSLEVQNIQLIAGHEYLDYRGEQMRLLRLEDYLPVQKPIRDSVTAHIILPKHTKIPVALLINRVLDTKNSVIQLENSTLQAPGILGSMILEGKIILLLDLYQLLEIAEPQCVEKIVVNREKIKNKQILLVEDTPFFMKVIRECLVTAGYQVTTAVNGHEALETLNQQTFDLILTDIEMPLMDGREMVKNLRANARWNHLPVIALTTLSDEQTVAEGKKLGFNDWLVKLDKELVLKTLAKYL